MRELTAGEYFGSHKQKLKLGSLILTDTEYTLEKVDWHYHENPYFTYLIQGKVYEAGKKKHYHLTPGSLLFHNWQDAHFNIKPPEYTRGFHIELNAGWFEKYDLKAFDFEGSIQLQNPLIKAQMNKIFLESKVNDGFSGMTIDSLLLDIFSNINQERNLSLTGRPLWVKTLKELILEAPERCASLSELAGFLDIHPVHLSREFPKYFNATLGEYLRKQKINDAALLIAGSNISLTEIGYRCGFYDQSHFISHFKRVFGLSPLKFRKQLDRP